MTTKSPQALNAAKARRRQLNEDIAEAARHLVALVRKQVDERGRVDSSLISDIKIDRSSVCISFIDYPDEFSDLVEWRRR